MIRLVEASGLAIAGRLSPTSLDLAEGKLACLVGPNGSGKTSLLHAVAGIGAPEGQIRIDGVDPRSSARSQRSRLLAFVPATREAHWPLTARDLVRLGGASDDEVEAQIAALELAGVADRRIDRLSTGERSRVLIARALAPRPRLLLLDEPTAHLDPLWQIRLMEMLRRSLVQHRQTALVAIHDLDSAARCADRLMIMQGGRLVADGPPGELIAGPWIRQVFGIERVQGQWRPAAAE